MKRLIALVFTLLPVTVLFADGEQFSFGFAPRIFGVTVTGEYAFSEPTIVDVETSVVATRMRITVCRTARCLRQATSGTRQRARRSID